MVSFRFRGPQQVIFQRGAGLIYMELSLYQDSQRPVVSPLIIYEWAMGPCPGKLRGEAPAI